MGAIRNRLGDALRRWRVARYERKQLVRSQEDRRRDEHTERIRQGIKDVPPPDAGW